MTPRAWRWCRLVAPTTTPERIAEIGADARGFVYTVSLTGTTGERSELPPGLADTVSRVRAATEVPVAVGFGISTPEQARSVAEIADGVIVGSRVVRAAGEGGPRRSGSWWASSPRRCGPSVPLASPEGSTEGREVGGHLVAISPLRRHT